MREKGPVEIELSEREWNEKVSERKDSWLELTKKIVAELERISGEENTGVFTLMGEDMRSDIAERAGLEPEELENYAAFHWITCSTPDFDLHRKVDLPGNKITQAFEEKLEDLKEQK